MSPPCIGLSIKFRRRNAGFTAATLARCAGLDLVRVREIEGGAAPTSDELSCLAGALGCDPVDLAALPIRATR